MIGNGHAEGTTKNVASQKKHVFWVAKTSEVTLYIRYVAVTNFCRVAQRCCHSPRSPLNCWRPAPRCPGSSWDLPKNERNIWIMSESCLIWTEQRRFVSQSRFYKILVEKLTKNRLWDAYWLIMTYCCVSYTCQCQRLAMFPREGRHLFAPAWWGTSRWNAMKCHEQFRTKLGQTMVNSGKFQ